MAMPQFGASFFGSPPMGGYSSLGGGGGFSASGVDPRGRAATRPQQSLIPDWMGRTADTSALTQFQGQIPGLFNTKPMMQAARTASAGMVDAGRASANAGATAYANRQMQAGGTAAGAGFAAAQSMLPYYQQQREGMAQAQQAKAGIRANQAGVMGNVASDIARLSAAQRGMMSQHSLGQQNVDLDRDRFNFSQYQYGNQLAQQQQNAASPDWLQKMQRQKGALMRDTMSNNAGISSGADVNMARALAMARGAGDAV